MVSVQGLFFCFVYTDEGLPRLDEQDVFGSDFESTDEEAEKQIEEAGEAEVTQEEKRIRKVCFLSSY